MRTFFRWLAITLAAMMALLLMAVLVLSLLDVTIDLDHLRGGVETSAGAALGRDVSIRGGRAAGPGIRLFVFNRSPGCGMRGMIKDESIWPFPGYLLNRRYS